MRRDRGCRAAAGRPCGAVRRRRRACLPHKLVTKVGALQLFLWQVSGSLTGPAEVDTGLKFINKETVAPYVNSKSRFKGTSSEPKVVPIPAGTPA